MGASHELTAHAERAPRRKESHCQTSRLFRYLSNCHLESKINSLHATRGALRLLDMNTTPKLTADQPVSLSLLLEALGFAADRGAPTWTLTEILHTLHPATGGHDWSPGRDRDGNRRDSLFPLAGDEVVTDDGRVGFAMHTIPGRPAGAATGRSAPLRDHRRQRAGPQTAGAGVPLQPAAPVGGRHGRAVTPVATRPTDGSTSGTRTPNASPSRGIMTTSDYLRQIEISTTVSDGVRACEDLQTMLVAGADEPVWADYPRGAAAFSRWRDRHGIHAPGISYRTAR